MAFQIAEGVIPIRADDQTAAGVAAARARLSNIRASAKLDADIDKFERKIRVAESELRSLASMRPSPEVDARTETARRNLRQLRTEAEAMSRLRIAMRAEVDTARGRANLRGLGAEADGADRRVRGLSSSGRGLGSSFASAARVPAILLGIASAAGAAGAALGALPALAASAGGIGGVLAGSFSGVGDALKGYTADQEAATAAGRKGASGAASSGRQIRDAMSAVDDARENAARVAVQSGQRVEDAERSAARTAADGARAVQDAKAAEIETARRGAQAVEEAGRRAEDALDGQREAQDDLTRAYVDAGRALDDLREKVSDYALDQEGAAIRVVEAEDQLRAVMADGESTALDRRKAEYELATAKERVSDLTREQAQSTAELADAERKGLAGSDLVLAAQGRLSAAVETTEDAQRALRETTDEAARANREASESTSRAQIAAAEANADAAREVGRAQDEAAQANSDAAERIEDALQGVQDATEAQAASAGEAAVASTKYADAMAKLSPAGRDFVRQLLAMKPLVDGLRNTSQESFLPGLTQMLRDSEGLFPIFDGHLRNTGSIMNETARDFGEMFKSPEFKSNLKTLLDSSLPITQAIGDGMLEATRKTVEFGARMAPASEGFADFITSVVAGYTGMLDELEPHSESFRRIWESLGRIMEVLLPVVGELVGELADRLAPVLEDVAGWLERNRDNLDDWAFAVGGAVLAVKGLNIANKVVTWCSDIAGGIGKIGNKADDVGGKLGDEKSGKGLLGKLARIGAVAGGVTIAAKIVGEVTPGEVDDPNQSLPQFFGNSVGDNVDKLFNLDFSGYAENFKRFWGRVGSDAGSALDGLRVTVATKFGEAAATGIGKAGELQAGVSGWFGRTLTDSDSWFSRTRTSIGGHMSGARDWATERAGSLWGGVTGWWGRTFGDSDSWFNRTRLSVGGHMLGARNWAVERAGSLWGGVTGWWGRTFGDSDSWFSRTRTSIGNHLSGARNWAVERAGSLWGGVTGWWSRTFGDSNSTFGRLRDAVGNHMRDAKDRALRWAGDAWRGVTGWFGRMWGDLGRLGRDGVNGVVRALNWLSDKGNVVLRFLKVPTIPGIPYLAQGGVLGPQMLASGGRVGGGFMTNGPQAIVGEGRAAYPEYVIPTDPAYRSRAMDLFSSLGGQLMAGGGQVPGGGAPQLAEGGILGWLGGAVGSAWRGVTNFAGTVGNKLGDVMSWVGGGVGGLLSESLNAVRDMLPGEPWRGIGVGVAGGAFDGIRKMIEGSFMASGDPGGAGVQRWAPLVLRALSMMGQPASLLNVVLRRMNQESGGNPTIFNNWDSNARKGTPSGGLMQTIKPTFDAYHFPGTSWNMLDPLANILASMRYAMARYGSLPAAYNRPGGYKNGGTIPGTGNRDSVPILAQPGERVLTTQQNSAFERLVSWLDDNAGGLSGRPERPVQVVVQQVAGDPQETGRFVALGLRSVA